MNATILDNLTAALDSLAILTATVDHLARQAQALHAQLTAARADCAQVDASPFPGTAAAAAEESVAGCRQSAALLSAAVATLTGQATDIAAALEATCDLVGGDAVGQVVTMPCAAQVTAPEAADPGHVPEDDARPDHLPDRQPQLPLTIIQPDHVPEAPVLPDHVPQVAMLPLDSTQDEQVPLTFLPAPTDEQGPLTFLPTPTTDEPAPKRGRRRGNPGSKAATLLLAAPDGAGAAAALVNALQAAGRLDLIEALARLALEALPTAAA